MLRRTVWALLAHYERNRKGCIIWQLFLAEVLIQRNMKFAI